MKKTRDRKKKTRKGRVKFFFSPDEKKTRKMKGGFGFQKKKMIWLFFAVSRASF